MKSWIIFWDMWKGYWGHISAFTNKVFWEHSHACFVAYCPWLPLCHNDRVLSLQKRPCDMQNPKVYFLAHYENCLPTPLYKDLSFKVWVTLLSFASRRQTQWHSKRATRIPLLASWPSTCVIRNSWRACFSHLIPYDWADPSSKLICSHEGLMMVAKGGTGLLRCPFIMATDQHPGRDLCMTIILQKKAVLHP